LAPLEKAGLLQNAVSPLRHTLPRPPAPPNLGGQGSQRAGERGNGGPMRRKAPIQNLVVVADGPLLDIPFAALMDNQGKRLMDRFAVSAAFSLGCLTWEDTVSKPIGSLFAVADTTGGKAIQIGKPVQMPSARSGYGRLEHAREETEAITKLFPQPFALLGEKG